jgi:hypothetical protein
MANLTPLVGKFGSVGSFGSDGSFCSISSMVGDKEQTTKTNNNKRVKMDDRRTYFGVDARREK